MTQASAAFGVVILVDSNPVAEVLNVNDIEKVKEFIEVTNHASPGGYREYIPAAVKNVPELGFEANYIIGDTKGQRVIESAFENGTPLAVVFAFPNGRSESGTAYVKSYKLMGPLEEQIRFEAIFQFTGATVSGYSASAGLTTFSLDGGAVINPTPAGNVYSYVATVATEIDKVKVTPTATTGTITVNGAVVANGQASGDIALGGVGSVTAITIQVTESGKTPKTYTVWVSRAAS